MEHATFLTNTEVIFLPVDKIKTNPYQPRRFFDRSGLDELASSIREYGVMQPISVRLINGCSYELVAGERRLRASKLAGRPTIPAIMVNITDQDSAILAIIENLQRQNLNFWEEAEGFQNLIHDYGFTQEEMATRIGKSQSTIANKLRILKLPKAVQKLMLENDLSERHARALLRIDNEETQLEILHKVIQNTLTVKKTEELIEAVLNKKADPPAKNKGRLRQYMKDIRLFTNTIRQAVGIMNDSGMETSYDMRETDEGYEIRIFVNRNERQEA